MRKIPIIITVLITFLLANYNVLFNDNKAIVIIMLILAFIIVNIFPTLDNQKELPFWLRMCRSGNHLLVSFIISVILSIILFIYNVVNNSFNDWKEILISGIIIFITEAVVFWNGMIRLYCTSVQLGLKSRILGVIMGFIPVANLIMLFIILNTTIKEVEFESRKIELNKGRENEKICSTKYPILLVHGIFFRDMGFINYWGRIPGELEKNGANIFYGKHDSAASVADSGEVLSRRIREIVEEAGCKKVNIIAHSKGGLDSRYAIACGDTAQYVASLTTINTPHRGCLYADYLLKKVSKKHQNLIEKAYNRTAKKLGDDNPDFMSAVKDLTEERCKIMNEEIPEVEGIYKASVGSVLDKATHGKFPLNFTYYLAKYFGGANDGLVSVDSFKWGDKYTLISTPGKRGVSHGDIIDLNRENISDFDVREFYVQMVSDLKKMGL